MLRLLFPTFWNVNTTPTSVHTVLYRVLHDILIAFCRLDWCCTEYMFTERQHASGIHAVSSILSWYCVIYRDLYLTGFQMYSSVFRTWQALMRRLSRPLHYDRD